MNRYQSSQRMWFAAFLTGFVAVLDQTTKVLAQKFLFEKHSQPFIDKLVFWTLTKNEGIAFGLFKDFSFLFTVFSVLASIIMVVLIYLYLDSLPAVTALSFILGGTIGNLIDRILYGGVIDFIDLRFWPVFNVADVSIAMGALCLAVGAVLKMRKRGWRDIIPR